MLCEYFSSDSDLIESMNRTMSKHPGKSIAGVLYYRNYLIFEIGA
jgi:hypothetical protein